MQFLTYRAATLTLATIFGLTEVAGEGGPHLAPQNFLLSQQLGTS